MAHSWEGKLRKAIQIKGWITLSVMLFLWGCATTQDVKILDREIDKLHSQLNLIQKEKDSLKYELETSQKDISTLRTDLGNELKKLQADLFLRLETLQSDLRVLSTGVEEYKELLKRPSKEIDRVREDIALRTRLLEERGKAYEEKNKALEDRTKIWEEQIKGMEDRFKGLEDRLKGLDGKMDGFISKQTETEKSTPTKEVPSEIKGVSARVGDLYRDAYETFQKGDLEGARRKFEAFLKQYPNTELSDNAQFWIGETYYLKKDFEKAILEYEKAIAKYPEGDKIPAALFKQALAFLELGDKTNARSLLKRVIERYPHSEQAEMAKKKLEGIK
jgi:tol-pal system protein YbgF